MLHAPPATLRQLLRRRPAALEVLENALGSRFWDHLEFALPDFGSCFGLNPGDLLDKVAALPPVPADTSWETKPLCHLIDRLTVEHDGFRRDDLPRLRSLLDGVPVRSWSDRYARDLIRQDFEAFARDFLHHMDEEEETAFPELMRKDSLLRHPGGMPPRKGHGSGLPGPYSRPTLADEDFGRMLVDIQDKLRHQRLSSEAGSGLDRLLTAMADFQAKLARHARLETGELYSRVARLETRAPGMADPRM